MSGRRPDEAIPCLEQFLVDIGFPGAERACGAITHQILQDQEVLIRHSHKVIDDRVNAG